MVTILLCGTNEEYSTSDPGRRVILETHNCSDIDDALMVIENIMRSAMDEGQWLEVYR